MKVCITSQGRDLSAQLDPRFGRAAAFIIVDTDGGDFQVVDNKQNLQAAQGAGIQAAQTVAGTGVKVVITGHCGPKAYRTLAAAGVKIYSGASGTVAEALEAFKAGKLSDTGGPDVEGHW